jgi:hypothetical protein
MKHISLACVVPWGQGAGDGGRFAALATIRRSALRNSAYFASLVEMWLLTCGVTLFRVFRCACRRTRRGVMIGEMLPPYVD